MIKKTPYIQKLWLSLYAADKEAFFSPSLLPHKKKFNLNI